MGGKERKAIETPIKRNKKEGEKRERERERERRMDGWIDHRCMHAVISLTIGLGLLLWLGLGL